MSIVFLDVLRQQERQQLVAAGERALTRRILIRGFVDEMRPNQPPETCIEFDIVHFGAPMLF